jgi:hypothetical protein
LHVANCKPGYGSQQNRIVKPSKTNKMTTLYIFLGFEAVILTAWIIYALNTELELYCWINKKRVFCGYFDNLSDLNKHVYKLEALHGKSLTDWIIRTVRKHRYVKQISGLKEIVLKDAIYMEEVAATQLISIEKMAAISEKMKTSIALSKQTIERTKQFLNEN